MPKQINNNTSTDDDTVLPNLVTTQMSTSSVNETESSSINLVCDGIPVDNHNLQDWSKFLVH